MKKSILFIFITMLLLIVLTSSTCAANVKVLRLAHLNPQEPTEIATAAMSQVFKSMVESGTNNEIIVEIYPNGVLGNERETMEQVQSGVTQSYIASGGGMAIFYPLFSIVDIPFSISHYSVAYEVYDGAFGQELAQSIEAKTGFKVLAFGESGGFFQLTNNKRPIRKPEDMKGLKIRTMTIPMHQNFMRSLGASATPIAWAEVYTSLQTGVVDGQHNPAPIIKIGKLEEVQKYLTLTNHMYTPYVWVINQEWFNSLTDHQKSVIQEAARIGNLAGRGVNRLIETSDKGVPYLATKMEVYTPTAEELQQFKEVTIPAAMEFIETEFKEEGKILAEKYLKAIKEAQKKLNL